VSGLLHLTITTPDAVVVDTGEVAAIRARDESGSFGIHPGHADLLTVLPASVVRWRDTAGETRYCAVRSGVFTVTGGTQAAIACREAHLGDRLEELEASVLERKAGEEEASRNARVAQMQMHARAVRQLMQYLAADGQAGIPDLLGRAAEEQET
jgi:F-type H+-transporting ATPase subunit epsilon